jgi:YfiH family protein
MSKNNHWLAPNWPAPVNIHAATTLRTGGISKGPYLSLNPATHVKDLIEPVLQNRKIISDMLSLPAEPIWLDQIHSNKIVKAEKTALPQQADASYSSESGVVCAVMTADCLPLLICSKDGKKIAAVHAGWRGLLAGVITNSISVLASQAPMSQLTELLIWLGPAIGPNCFEIGTEVREAFIDKSQHYEKAFKLQNNQKYLADIYQLAKIELSTLGISDIYGGTYCTMTEEDRFFSYRRDNQTGRMATLIWKD